MKLLELLRIFIMINILIWYLFRYILESLSNKGNTERINMDNVELPDCYDNNRCLFKYF